MTATITETVSSFTDLITKVDTWMQALGWTQDHLDVTSTPTTGGEWAMHRTNSEGTVRFAASWDGAGTPSNLALYQYEDSGGYNASKRPWEQDGDSGNGYAGKTDASIAGARYVAIGTSPIRYWGFENPNYTRIVVEVATGEYKHFGFEIPEKKGDWTGGAVVYGQKDSGTTGAEQANRDDRTYLLDGLLNDTSDVGGVSNGSELYAATIHCEDLPNQPANGMWGVCMGGKQGSPQTDFGQDRQSNDGASSDTDRVLFTWGLRAGPWANSFYRSGGSSLSGELGLWPICTTYVDTTTGDIYGFPIARSKDVFGCTIKNFVAGDTVTDDEGETYTVFPAHKKYSGSGAQTGTSGYLGIAYKTPVYEDPGLPSSITVGPTGWWSSRLPADYQLSGSEVIQLYDKSGNANHFTVPGGETGPDITTIDGRTWLDYPTSEGRIMSATNTDVDINDDVTYIAVYKCTNTTSGGIFGKTGTGNYNYGFFISVSNSRSLYFQCRDNILANTLVLHHDDAGTDYSDDTARICAFTYDDGEGDAFLYGGANDLSTSVDSNLVYASNAIVPDNDLFLGDWSSALTLPFEGEIAEVICFNYVLSGTQRSDIEDYLRDKWGFA